MRAKITARLLDTVRPKDAPFEVADTQMTGFILRVEPTGRKIYFARFRLASGKQTRYRIGDASVLSVAQARALAREVLAGVAHGEDPVASKRSGRLATLGEYLDTRYMPWAETHLKSGAVQVQRIRSGFPHLLKKKLAEVTAWAVEKHRGERIKAGVKPATANKDTAALRAALQRAHEWNMLPDGNPLQNVRRVREEGGARVRFLDADEERRLLEALEAREQRIRDERRSYNTWAAAREYPLRPDLDAVAFADYLKPMVLISLDVGLRRGELFGLEWRDVDLDRAMLSVRAETSKSGKGRYIPLSKRALEALRAWRVQSASQDGLVFPSRGGARFDNTKKAWQAVLKAAAIENFRWHDMRHCFASKLVTRGVDLNTVREFLGHSDYKMVLVYAHLAPAAKARAIAVLDDEPANVVHIKKAAQSRGEE